jgi:hypothetical protein
MTEDEIVQVENGLPGVVVEMASEASGAPEMAWGDSSIYYDPDGTIPSDRRMPFATIVTSDYEGFDTDSNLNCPNVFRLNIEVGREAFHDLIGYEPIEHPDHHEQWDYAAADQLIPHPLYAKQAWVSIVNPGEAADAQARSLLTDAHARAARRHRPQA